MFLVLISTSRRMFAANHGKRRTGGIVLAYIQRTALGEVRGYLYMCLETPGTGFATVSREPLFLGQFEFGAILR